MTGLFDPSPTIENAVRKALADKPDIPVEHHGAVVLVANQDGIHAVAAIRVGKDWDIGAGFSYDHAHGLAYSAEVMGTF